MAMTSKDVKALVMEAIQGTVPPWVAGWDMGDVFPTNAITGKAYRGSNALLGMALAMKHGSNLFATNKQWYTLAKKLGYFSQGSKPLLQRDENGKPVGSSLFVYANTFLRKQKEGEEVPPSFRIIRDGETFRKWFCFSAFYVYNIRQLVPELQKLVEDSISEKKAARKLARHDAAESFISAMKEKFSLSIEFGKPSYSPKRDVIFMPALESFHSYGNYAGAMAHEIGHWTGAASRMNRETLVNNTCYGNDVYAEEEAVAEWFSLLLCNELGCAKAEQQNSASYISGWTSKFGENPELLPRTFEAAEKAFQWLMKEMGIEPATWEAEEATEEAIA